jgi:hypothetical protein
MNTNQRILALGVLALAIGGGLAVLLTPKAKPQEPALAPAPRAPGANSRHLADLQDSATVPEEDEAANQYNRDRWGHLTDNVLVVPHTDSTGEPFYQDTKIFVGLDGNGKQRYLRAIHRPVYDPNLKRLTAADAKDLPTVSVTDWKPGPALEKLKKIKHATSPSDLPPNLQPQHPLYEGGSAGSGGGASGGGSSGAGAGGAAVLPGKQG